MKYTTKGPVTNRIADIRRRNRLTTEQVSILLGEKDTERLEQYESGTKTPNLKTALKLAHIFNLPIRIMLDGYYAACRSEIKKEQLPLAATSRAKREVAAGNSAIDFCTFDAGLAAKPTSEREISKARRHAVNLIRTTAEKLGHI